MTTETGSESEVKNAAEEPPQQKGATMSSQDTANADGKKAKQDHDAKHLDDKDHRDADEASEKTTPSKAPKSPQKTSKRPKTVLFKVTLLDSSEYEDEIEVVLFELTVPNPKCRHTRVPLRLCVL
nr:PREDICTED: band 4.1-like protein 1 [Lepisosteus oculatus]